MRKTSPPSRKQTPARRRFFNRRIVRKFLFVFGGLILLVLVLYVEENIRGKAAWQKYKKELEAKGEKLDWQSFIPPVVPDAENFAMTPFLGSLFDFDSGKTNAPSSGITASNSLFDTRDISSHLSGSWSRSEFTHFKTNGSNIQQSPADRQAGAAEMLKLLVRYEPITKEIRTASQRPHARFNVHYEQANVAGIAFAHLAPLKSLGVIFRADASAQLALGNSEIAANDVAIIIYLSNTLTNDPVLISGLVRLALFQIAFQPMWEGLAQHQWDEVELIDFEKRLGAIDALKEFDFQLRGERALNLAGLEYYRTVGPPANDPVKNDHTSQGFSATPGGWIYLNEVALARMYDIAILPPVNSRGHRVYPPLSERNQKKMRDEFAKSFPPTTIFASSLLNTLSKSQIRYAELQTRIDEARIACALERFRLAHHDYPQSLAELVPQFIERLPNDLFNGESLKYRRTDSDRFLLYSIGWDEKDDEGAIAFSEDSQNLSVDLYHGDWIWPQYPAMGSAVKK